MEDLNLARAVGRSMSKEFGLPYNRMVRLLRLGSIKVWLRQQANNRGIRVHFTPPAYTSQECSECHFIHRGNRNEQAFKCLRCGHEQHSDHNAATTVRSRYLEDVLRDKLHTVDKLVNGNQLKSKRIRYMFVKHIICDHYDKRDVLSASALSIRQTA